MARQKQSSTSSRPRKRSRGSTASPSSSNGNNLNNGMHCACVFHVGVQHLCAYLTRRRVGDVYRVAIAHIPQSARWACAATKTKKHIYEAGDFTVNCS